MKPSLPLTSTTRQLKEVGETRDENDNTSIAGSPVTTYTSTGMSFKSESEIDQLFTVNLYRHPH